MFWLQKFVMIYYQQLLLSARWNINIMIHIYYVTNKKQETILLDAQQQQESNGDNNIYVHYEKV